MTQQAPVQEEEEEEGSGGGGGGGGGGGEWKEAATAAAPARSSPTHIQKTGCDPTGAEAAVSLNFAEAAGLEGGGGEGGENRHLVR
jgi:hypothetical protein